MSDGYFQNVFILFCNQNDQFDTVTRGKQSKTKLVDHLYQNSKPVEFK